MTDRELLEMSAKAADIKIWFSDAWYDVGECLTGTIAHNSYWNPLENDTDAFRLACQLNMDVVVRDGYACVDLFSDDVNCFAENIGGNTTMDKCTATRRVIVRAAAHIGSCK